MKGEWSRESPCDDELGPMISEYCLVVGGTSQSNNKKEGIARMIWDGRSTNLPGAV